MSEVATVVLLLLIVIIINGSTEESTCGRLGPSLTGLITNTHETTHWPWHSAIYHKYNRTSIPVYKCGGTLINSKSVLTAAHCVCIHNMKMDTRIISVSLGCRNLAVTEKSTQTFEADEIIVHPDFNSIDYVNDIAIIKLSAEAVFNNYVQPCCLWKSSKKNISEVVGKYGTVVGWGLTENDRIANVVREASLPVVSWDTCLRSNPDVIGGLLSDRNFCAGFQNGTNVCTGDSGGSMIFEENDFYYIRGIVSVSPSKLNRKNQEVMCDPSQYALFTDVAQYLPWISNTTAIILECETKVRCKGYRVRWGSKECRIVLRNPPPKCKIIIDEASYAHPIPLIVQGEFDVIPDLSHAVDKFKKLDSLTIAGMKLKTVERSNFVGFQKHLKSLYLYFDRITQLDADTFYDLKNLEILDLHENELEELHPDLFNELHRISQLRLDTNQLNDVHPDLFKELHNLEYLNLANNQMKQIHPDLFKELLNLNTIDLNQNQLEILPRGLFRSNRKLTRIEMQFNKINKIEFVFHRMPILKYVNLKQNVCIDKLCDQNFYDVQFVGSMCFSFDDINEQIQRNCA